MAKKKVEVSTKQITEIVFRHTGNHFLNAGIVALDYYLEEFQDKTEIKYKYSLSELELKIESEQLFKLLEDVYYYMGKELYDTSGSEARSKADKYYFIKDPFQAIPFAKMKTYGLAELITNDPTPVEGKNGEKIKFEKLFERDIDLATQISMFLSSKGKKLKYYSFVNGSLKKNEINDKGKVIENKGGESEVFINSPYTKTTNIEMDINYFIEGDKVCYLTGEKYQKLVDSKCTSPFLSGLLNFNSFLSGIDKKISWKAMYLSRFCPKLGFYTYSGGLDNLMSYLFSSDNLLNLKLIFNSYRSLFKNEIQMIGVNYFNNFNLYNFGIDNEKFTIEKDLYFENENLFMLIYSFFKLLFEKHKISDHKEDGVDELLVELEIDIKKLPPISLVSLKAVKFAGTMRTDYFEEFDNFKFILRMIAYFETQHISLKDVFFNLKFIKGSDKKRKDSYKLERMLRNKTLGRVLKNVTIAEEIENLFYQCYNDYFSDGFKNYRNYSTLADFTYVYEQIIKYGGNKTMDDNLQIRAINLGTSIGQGILIFQIPLNASDQKKKDLRKANAEKARKYIIALKKARTLEQFNNELIRLQNKFGLCISKDILENITEQNYNLIKQFAIISSLNQLNSVLNPKKSEDKNITEGESHE
ncbi:MAG TPA: hypothetical protein PLP37_08070 [Clostridiales bacterium]|nr:hypothetical protein [Clostridiales bacterium]